MCNIPWVDDPNQNPTFCKGGTVAVNAVCANLVCFVSLSMKWK